MVKKITFAFYSLNDKKVKDHNFSISHFVPVASIAEQVKPLRCFFRPGY